MLNRSVGRACRGWTLVELMAAVAVAGVVLTVVAGIALRQQRTFAALAADAALAGQLRDAASLLPMDLRAAAVGAGDIREATDTSIEVRETIASAVVCDTLGASIVLAPPGGHATTLAAIITTIHAGDTAWVFSPDDSIPTWRARRVNDVGLTHAGQCIPGGPQLGGGALTAARTTLSLDSVSPPATLIGRPLRITRPIRYSLYRSSDDRWYLGARDWNSTTLKFNAIQPVAGPFDAPAGAPVFQWYDSAGATLVTPVVARDRIALVRIDLRGRTRGADRILGSSHDSGPRGDSVSILVSMRNRS